MTEVPDAAVVIVSYNTREQLGACLDSLRSQAPSEVVVVDNGSTDGSSRMVRAHHPEVALLESTDNPGYGVAANRGIAACRAPYVLLLNADTRLNRGALATLARYLEEHPRVAVAGPRLDHPDGSLQPSRFPELTPFNTLVLNTYLLDLARRLPPLRRRFLPVWVETPQGRADWVKGAALALRRQAFEEIGGFDPSYFMYAEDLDLCHRLRSDGWEVHYVPSARVVHEEGASTRQRPVAMGVRFFDSLELFYRRHYPGSWIPRLRLVVTIIMSQRLLRGAISWLRRSDPAYRRELGSRMRLWWRILARQWGRARATSAPDGP